MRLLVLLLLLLAAPAWGDSAISEGVSVSGSPGANDIIVSDGSGGLAASTCEAPSSGNTISCPANDELGQCQTLLEGSNNGVEGVELCAANDSTANGFWLGTVSGGEQMTYAPANDSFVFGNAGAKFDPLRFELVGGVVDFCLGVDTTGLFQNNACDDGTFDSGTDKRIGGDFYFSYHDQVADASAYANDSSYCVKPTTGSTISFTTYCVVGSGTVTLAVYSGSTPDAASTLRDTVVCDTNGQSGAETVDLGASSWICPKLQGSPGATPIGWTINVKY